ncbi:MAG TPA: M56 family metallopeptidase [Longimicrobium sp.]|nr:M56 family metallopeptidase [Longimicrobium sp.]
MNGWMALDPVWSPEWAWLRYATSLRATLLLLIFAAAALLLRRAPASVRAQLWAAALIALLPLPELRMLPLHWSAHVVPSVLAEPMLAIGSTMVAQSWPGALPLPWTMMLGIAWMAGAALVLGRLAWGWCAVALLSRRARPVADAGWLALLDECSAALGVRRRVRLLRARGIGTPLTWGTLRPAVVLPADADGWPEAHRRAVLLHELAHVRRLDCLLQLFAHLTCALWWFHPGAWWAAHRLGTERERACDERVLRAGVRPSDYAECLLRIADGARGFGAAGPAIVAAGFLRRGQLRLRLRAILTPAPRRAPSPAVSFATAMACAALVLVVGSMRLSPRPDVLWTALGSPDWTRLAFAAESIARFGAPASVAALQATLRTEPNPAVPAMARFGARLRPRSHQGALVRFGWPRG